MRHNCYVGVKVVFADQKPAQERDGAADRDGSVSRFASEDASPPSSLDAIETKSHLLLPTMTASQRKCFAGMESVRDHVLLALVEDDEVGNAKRTARLVACCQSPMIHRTGSGKPVISLGRCRDRLCPVCAKHRSRQTAGRLVELVRSMNAPKLLTLTLREDGRNLGERFDRLLACFRELRRRTVWKRNVRGGVYSVEVTRGRSGDGWHVHLHCVMDADFIAQNLLADEWENVTGDSRVVDVRAVHDREKTAKYVTKYISKVSGLLGWSRPAVAEFASAMKRRRMLSTFGSCHNLVTEQDDEAENVGTIEAGVSCGRIRWAARSGCAAAVRCECLAVRAGGVFCRAFGLSPRSKLDGGTQPLTEEEWADFDEQLRLAGLWLDGKRDEEARTRKRRSQLDARLWDDEKPPNAQLHA